MGQPKDTILREANRYYRLFLFSLIQMSNFLFKESLCLLVVLNSFHKRSTIINNIIVIFLFFFAQKIKKQRGYYTASFILALSDTISFSLPDTSHPPMNGFASLNRISLVTLLSLVVKDLLSSTSLLFTFISSFQTTYSLFSFANIQHIF